MIEFNKIGACVMLLLMNSTILAQNWGDKLLVLYNQAQIYHNSQEYALEAALYDTMVLVNDGYLPDDGISEYAFEAHNLAGNYKKSIEYFIKYNSSTWISDERMDELLSLPKYTVIREDSIFGETIRMNMLGKRKYQHIVKEINRRRVRDQFFRKHNKAILESIGEDSESLSVYEDLYAENDLRNSIWLEEMVKSHGWLSKNKIGDKANTTQWLILQHSPISFQERLLPFLKKSVDEGESSRIDYAMLVDRMHFNSLTKQIYGTQIESIIIEGKSVNVIYPIQNPSLVNNRRKSMGLESLEEYARFFKIEIENVNDLGNDDLLEKIKIKRQQN